jgi:hypothetical protein
LEKAGSDLARKEGWRAMRRPVAEQKEVRPHTKDEFLTYLRWLWATHDTKYTGVPLAAETFMVDRGARLTFVRRIELMDASSLKIITPFAVKGAGGKMFARIAGTLLVYLENGRMLVINPVYYILDLSFNMLSEECDC